MALLTLLAATPSYSASKPGETSAQDAACKKYGPSFVYLEQAGVCVKHDLTVFGNTGMDFAQEDIEMHGDRFSVPLTGKQLPLLTYEEKDVSNDTNYLKVGAGISNDVTVVRDTKGGPLVAFLSAGVFTDGDLSGQNDIFEDQNIYNNGAWNFYPGVLQQAWVRYQGLQVGIQPSQFDFISAGYTAFGGYASRDSTLGAAVAKTFGNTSVAFSVEDSSRRNREDGVLANYDDGAMFDPVLQLRTRYKNGLYHASAAIHRVTYDGSAFGMDDGEAWGAAARFGAMYEFRSKGDPDVKGDEELSRIMATVALAEGATGYLGVPNFVIDYTADGESDISLSRGVSGLVSSMRMLDEKTKLALTGSAFWVNMHVDETTLVELPNCDFTLDQDVDVSGAKLQVALERRLRPDLSVGGEASYTWTTVKGTYDGYDADQVSVQYPEIKAYVSWKIK